MTDPAWTIGVDACPGGWAGIAWSGEDVVGLVSPTIAGLAQLAASQ